LRQPGDPPAELPPGPPPASGLREPGDPPAELPSAPATTAAPAKTVKPADAATVCSSEDVPERLTANRQDLLKMAAVLQQARLDDALAYRLRRTGMWLGLELPDDDDGRTKDQAPSVTLRKKLNKLVAAEDWSALLEAAEDAAAANPLWLDANRLALTAMENLGASFIKARAEIVQELSLVVKRFPTLVELTFADGTPFADPQTKLWIETEVLCLEEDEPSSVDSVTDLRYRAVRFDETLDKARKLAVRNQLPEAISLINEATQSAPSPMARFLGRLAAAQLCVQACQFDVARVHLEGLVELIDRHDLTTWEPELCAEVYAAIYTAYAGVAGRKPTAEQAAKQREAFEQLCRLDMAAALKLNRDAKLAA